MKQLNIKQLLSANKLLFITLLFTLFFAVGIIGHVLPATRNLMFSLTPIFLFGFGGIALIPLGLEKSRGVYVWAVVTLVVTFFLEAAGTATGKIFGPYTYGATLGVKVMAVPVVIAFNWLIVIAAGLRAARFVTAKAVPSAFLAAAFALLFDYILEPAAIRLDYWIWQWDGIPLQNYIAWFSIAFVSALSFNLFRLKTETKVPLVYVLHQVVFFLVLRIVLGT